MIRSHPVKLVVLSGPSGVGKSTLVAGLRDDPQVFWSVSATTRASRSGEVDGTHYHFLSVEAFEKLRDSAGFLEHATVFQNFYGTLREPIEQALASGQIPLLDIDVQGALQVMEQDLPALFIFIKPPSLAELETRLRARKSDSDRTITLRVARAQDEMQYAERYDHVLTNDDLGRARAELSDILEKEIGWRPGAAR